MTISQTQLASFKDLYLQEYGQILSDAEAYEMASNLLGLYFTVYVSQAPDNDDDKP